MSSRPCTLPGSARGMPARTPGHVCGPSSEAAPAAVPAGLEEDMVGVGGPGAPMCFTPPHARHPELSLET